MKFVEEMSWTTNYLIEELHCYLESFEEENKDRKYERQAKDLIYRIPVYRPVPTYVVDKKDLTERLIREVQSYGLRERDELLKITVGRIHQTMLLRHGIHSTVHNNNNNS
jgi:hypothetical protein